MSSDKNRRETEPRKTVANKPKDRDENRAFPIDPEKKARPWTRKEMEEAEPLPMPETPPEENDNTDE